MFKIFKAKWILPANGQVIENGSVLIENGKIVDVFDGNSEPDEYYLDNADEIIDYKNAVITPGFINLHTHMQYTDLEKEEDQSSPDFVNWLIELVSQYFIWSRSKKTDSLLNGFKEAVLSGTTCIVQLAGEEEFFEIYNSLKARTYVFLETFSNNEESSEVEFEKLKEKISRLKQNKSEFVNIGISPHSVYNVHPALWKMISEYSLENDILIHTHLAESEIEMEWLKNGYSDIDLLHRFIGWSKVYPYETGLNPVQYLSKLNVLNENLITAHLNQLDEDDENSLEELFKNNVKIALCPRSNDYLHKKPANIEKILNYGFLPGIGTDSKFSNQDLNISGEVRFIKSSTNLDSLILLDMLTINSAKILKLDDKIGSLEKGKDADFLVFGLKENESWQDFLEKQGPDNVYVQGKTIVRDKKLSQSANLQFIAG